MSHDVHSPTPRLLLSLVSTALQSCGSCLVSYTLLPVLVIKVVNGVTFIDNHCLSLSFNSVALQVRRAVKIDLRNYFEVVKDPINPKFEDIFASVHATELSAGIL